MPNVKPILRKLFYASILIPGLISGLVSGTSFFILKEAHGATDRQVFLMPINCSELVPDTAPFINFFESVSRGLALTNRTLSRRLYRILALRDRLSSETGRVGNANPIDPLIRRFLCFYREQKNPLSAVTYDDREFRTFVQTELRALEKRIDVAVFEVALEESQRREYERKVTAEQSLVNAIKEEAEQEALETFEIVTSSARSKVGIQ